MNARNEKQKDELNDADRPKEKGSALQTIRGIFNARVFQAVPFLLTLSACAPEQKTLQLNEGEVKEVTVHPGDTLSSLSKHYGVSIEDIKSLNGLESDKIRTGAVLKISAPSETVHLHEIDPQKPAQYVVKTEGKWWAIDEYEEEGQKHFESKAWGDHPAWDESLLGEGAKYFKSDHTGEAVTLKKVEFIVLHSTISPKVESVSQEKKAQFVVDKKGKIYPLVDIQKEKSADGKAAPHAGESAWGENHKINENSIGIEVVALQGEEWNEKQIKSVKELVNWIGGYFDLPKDAVLRHAQVACFDPLLLQKDTMKGRGRKSDPIDKNLWKNLDLPNNDRLLDTAVLNRTVPMTLEDLKNIDSPSDGLKAALELSGKAE